MDDSLVTYVTLLLLFAAYMGSWLYLLVNIATKKVNKIIGSDIEEANSYNNINKLNNRYKSVYLNNSKDNKDEFFFTSLDINKLKLILY